MNDIIKHRQAVEEQIQKGFEVGFTGSDDLEKAHKVGDIHPNGKWVWTQLPSGRFDWRVIKKTAQPATTGGSAPAPQKPSAGGKTWDKISDFSIHGSDEAKLVAAWGLFMKRKDPHYMNVMRDIFQNKFPAVAKWIQTAPNTGKSEIRAVDSDKKEIASLDLSSGVKIPEIQTFMDKCSEVKSAAEKRTEKNDSEYSAGDTITGKNFDSFAKMVNSRKYNFFVVDTALGRRHRGGRITSVRGSDSFVRVMIHWMGNGENEKKDFYDKNQAAYYLNGLDIDIEKKK